MHIPQLILLISGFAGGLSMARLPDSQDPKKPQAAIWCLSVAVATFLVFLAVCAEYPPFEWVVVSSLAAGGAAFAAGLFIKKGSKPSLISRQRRLNRLSHNLRG
jgi:hypothetical protein